MDLRIWCVCSSTLILNRPRHCLCGGIVLKQIAYVYCSKECARNLKLYMQKR